MRKFALLIIASIPFLQSCGSVPVVQHPRIPQLDPLPQDVVEPSFTERIQSFLRGRLPEPISSEKVTNNASSNTKQ